MPMACSQPLLRLSKWRYVVVLMTAVAALWMYIDRVCFSTLATPIQRSLKIDDESMSYVLGAFFFAYALFQVPAGALADRCGSRFALAACIVGWSAATAATAFADSHYGLLAVRLILGMAEAGAYPAAALLIANWASPNERGTFSGIVSAGGRLGGASAPYLTAALAVALVARAPGSASSEGNWRAVFFVFGVCGLAVASAFWLLVRDRPRAAGMENRRPERTVASAPAPLWLILRSSNIWLCGATQFGVNVGWAFMVTLLPTYLDKVYQVPLEQRGQMQSVVLFVGCVGMLSGGFLTDRLHSSFGPRWCRSVPVCGTLLAGSCVFLAIPHLTSAWATIAAFACVAFLVDLGVPAIWAFNQDVGGRSVGKVFGWGNMWGNLGAALSPVLLARVALDFGWKAVFITCAGAFAFAGTCGMMMNAARPLEPLPEFKRQLGATDEPSPRTI
jgi:ACS family glucarate transporter-like MFS transporter